MHYAPLAFAEPLAHAPLDLASALARAQALDPGAVAAGEPDAVEALTDLLLGLLSAIDAGEEAAWTSAAALTPVAAEQCLALLILSRFPDGSGDTATLDDATVLLLVALSAAAGRGDDALALLASEAPQRRTPSFLRASWTARAHLLALPASLDTLWAGANTLSRAAAQHAIDTDPLDTRAHRALGRRLAGAGASADAIGAFARGLALPLPTDAKAGIAADLALLAVVVASTGSAELLSQRRLVLSLAADPAYARHALAALDAHPTIAARADPQALAAVRALFAGHASPAPGHSAPFPRRDGKTHLNMTFLEITNHCNQKCTFCPDMHRADARTWLPLDRVLRSIDELADGFSMNMMQLNAYGEPLLHPQIGEILAHIRAKKLAWPTFFTTHGLTLVDKKLKALSHNYPSGIAVSLHNDSQQSYAATRNNRIGDYDTMVARVSALMRQMAHEGADCHLRLYMMVQNAHEDPRVPPEVRHAFPDSPERMGAHVRKWEAIAHAIAAAAPHHVHARALSATTAEIERAWRDANDDSGIPLPILEWRDANGNVQQAFMSARPLETYANLLLEYHPDWTVERRLLNDEDCRFIRNPSLTLFATGKLGLCCLDLDGTATFGSIGDYPSLAAAVDSPEARRMFAELSNGVATSKGCQICLSTGTRQCGPGGERASSTT